MSKKKKLQMAASIINLILSIFSFIGSILISSILNYFPEFAAYQTIIVTIGISFSLLLAGIHLAILVKIADKEQVEKNHHVLTAFCLGTSVFLFLSAILSRNVLTMLLSITTITLFILAFSATNEPKMVTTQSEKSVIDKVDGLIKLGQLLKEEKITKEEFKTLKENNLN